VVAFTVTTVAVIAVHLFALMISTFVLPNLDGSTFDVAAIGLTGGAWRADRRRRRVVECSRRVTTEEDVTGKLRSPERAFERYITWAWLLSTVFGILLFIVDVALVAWVRFYRFQCVCGCTYFSQE
jgi:calcium release-activated calcium channel protein 1